MITDDRLKEIRSLMTEPEFKRPVCRGSLTLGTGCKICEKCSWHYRIAGTSQIIPELLDEIERLREALRPFAEMAREAEPYHTYRETYLANAIRFEDCQRARKVLGDDRE